MTVAAESPVFQVDTGPIDFGTVRLPAGMTFTSHDEYQRVLRGMASDLVQGYVEGHWELFVEATLLYMKAVGSPDTPAHRREFGLACVGAWAAKMIETTAVQMRRSLTTAPS